MLDALNKVAYDDDKQVAMLRTAKLYSEESSVVVTVKELTGDDIASLL